MKLKKTYSGVILITAGVLIICVGTFLLVTPFDVLQNISGNLVTAVSVIAFTASVAFALSLGYVLSKDTKGEAFTFKELNPGITFSIKAIEKKEPDKKDLFLEDLSLRYVVSSGDEIFILVDPRVIPEGSYFKDGKTGRIKRIDPSVKEL